MRIIIPMAGLSKRYHIAGYTVPKPFILIDGKPMIERVCRMFAPTDEFIFIANKEHLKSNKYVRILEGIAQKTKIVPIDYHGQGPTTSVLLAEDVIADQQEPMIITYCDFTMQWNYRQFLRKAQQYDGAMAVFRGFHPASFGDTYYAYLKADENMEMVELREKRSFTDNRSEEFASTGVYYLDSWNTFKHYARKLLESRPVDLKEYYCSLLFNPMVQDGKKVCLFEAEKFICWGTPEDLEEYNFWSEYYANHANRILQTEMISD